MFFLSLLLLLFVIDSSLLTRNKIEIRRRREKAFAVRRAKISDSKRYETEANDTKFIFLYVRS